jgi:hypothetical protein
MALITSSDGSDQNIPKFSKGEKVYFIGDSSKRSLENDKPYEVVECIPSDKKFYSLTIKNGDNFINDKPDNFVSEKEYKKFKNKKVKNDFNGGDTVYYNGPAGQEFEFDHAYTLFASPGGYFSLKLGKTYKEISKEVADMFFISQEEYKKKRGFTHEPDSSKILLSSLPGYTKHLRFNVGEKAYFMGDETRELKNDKPYVVQYFDNDKNIIRVNGVTLSGDDFITEKEYERINDSKEIVNIIGKKKNEIELKEQIFKDTKSGKLKWYRPYASMKRWYRTMIKLEKPENAYIKIDMYIIKADDNKWTMVIYFNRTNDFKNEIRIENYNESSITKAIVKYIEKNIEDEEEEEEEVIY